ncbi:CDP-alcohol phosphatidyltransferase family protein [Kosakonia cowanii]|uniref:CDP-alcohol phosphatidyltransferase family protein n=1 Tax=Kosakonia cowanii TaxID=208223 RepID=UPI0023F94DF3|nr:CDP-alcohol phosphatidyltransferase family protein [Kosakonia cowanii]MDF7759292.1 CDP-alcohol phosphatidyltransferase family protein [Kosakonia cowanii]
MRSPFICRLSLPDCLTLTGMVIALAGIEAALSGAIWLSISLLYLAMLADALDGKLARWLGCERPFGRYLDGFCDLLLYLVAPALIFYLSGYRGGGAFFLALMVVCGALRLSRFNESGNITHNAALAYLGMPVFWSLFILSGWSLLALFLPPRFCSALLSVTLTLFSLAMLLDRPFPKFSSLMALFSLCLSGAALFGALHLGGVYG